MKSILRVALLFFLLASVQMLRMRPPSEPGSIASRVNNQADWRHWIYCRDLCKWWKVLLFVWSEWPRDKRQGLIHPQFLKLDRSIETFTVVTYARLTIDGKIGYDDPFQKVSPGWCSFTGVSKIICSPMKDAENPLEWGDERHHTFTPYVCVPDASEKPQPILICYLATHFRTSWISAKPEDCEKQEWSILQIFTSGFIRFLKNYSLLEPIGYDYRHSPLGISLLGHVLALHEKKSFEDVVTDNLLRPLGMTNTGIGVTENININSSRIQSYRKSVSTLDLWCTRAFRSISIHPWATWCAFWKPTSVEKNELKKCPWLHAQSSRSIERPTKPVYRKSRLDESESAWDRIEPHHMAGWDHRWICVMFGFVETSHSGVVILSNCSVPLQEFGQKILQVLNK